MNIKKTATIQAAGAIVDAEPLNPFPSVIQVAT